MSAPEVPPVAPQPPTGLPWWAAASTRTRLAPHQVRRHALRGTLFTLSAGLTAVAALWVMLSATEVKDVTRTDFGALAHKQSTDALIAGCGPIYRFPTDEAAAVAGTVPPVHGAHAPLRLDYRTTVPMVGPFWERPAPTKKRYWAVEDRDIPSVESLMHNMWRGDMVIYYSVHVPDPEVAALRRIVESNRDLRMLAVPWEATDRGPLPQHRTIAWATWNASQSCHRFLNPALFDFREAVPAAMAPGHDGSRPPSASLVATPTR